MPAARGEEGDGRGEGEKRGEEEEGSGRGEGRTTRPTANTHTLRNQQQNERTQKEMNEPGRSKPTEVCEGRREPRRSKRTHRAAAASSSAASPAAAVASGGKADGLGFGRGVLRKKEKERGENTVVESRSGRRKGEATVGRKGRLGERALEFVYSPALTNC